MTDEDAQTGPILGLARALQPLDVHGPVGETVSLWLAGAGKINLAYEIMRHKNSKKLYDYWNRLRGDRPAPDRREIEPSDIRDLLGDTFILEIDQVYGNISFRLAGSRLCNAHGKELKGQGFLSLWDEKNNLEIYDLVRNVYRQCQPGVAAYQAISKNGNDVDCEMILFPLLNGNDPIARVLGASFQFDYPAWTGLDMIAENRLRYCRPVCVEEQTDAPPLETQLLQKPEAAHAGARKIGHLTVIEGGMK